MLSITRENKIVSSSQIPFLNNFYNQRQNNKLTPIWDMNYPMTVKNRSRNNNNINNRLCHSMKKLDILLASEVEKPYI